MVVRRRGSEKKQIKVAIAVGRHGGWVGSLKQGREESVFKKERLVNCEGCCKGSHWMRTEKRFWFPCSGISKEIIHLVDLYGDVKIAFCIIREVVMK